MNRIAKQLFISKVKDKLTKGELGIAFEMCLNYLHENTNSSIYTELQVALSGLSLRQTSLRQKLFTLDEYHALCTRSISYIYNILDDLPIEGSNRHFTPNPQFSQILYEENEVYNNSFVSLKEAEPYPENILTGNPFDNARNFSKRLSEEIFYRDLYHPFAKQSLDSFKKIIDDGNCRVLFVSGFAGTGKTTFIRTFERFYVKEYEHIVFDLQRIRIEKDGIEAVPRQVTDLILRSMKFGHYTREELLNSFKFIVEHQIELKNRNYISQTLINQLVGFNPINDLDWEKQQQKSTDCFGFLDTFTYFFISIFLTSKTNKTKIIYFDNLDNIMTEYLANGFLKKFQDAYLNALNLAQSPLFNNEHFGNKIIIEKFKFVFCLRDGNELSMIPHRYNILNPQRFRIEINAGFHTVVVNKRLALMEKLYVDHSDKKDKVLKFKRWFKILIKDFYFEKVFVKLFNNDYREATSSIFAVVSDKRLYFDESESRLGYMTRAILLHGILFNLNTKRRVRIFPFNKISSEKNTFCLPERMLLTYITNTQKNHHHTYFKEYKSIDLKSLLDDFEPIYDKKTIPKAIAKCFLYHKKNWTHLLSITDIYIKNKDRFIKDIFDKNTKLTDIKVRINPSGYTYVRYILPHFEFYSVLSLKDNDKSLFEVKITDTNPDGSYYFEFIIDGVLKMVETHFKKNMAYFNQYLLKQMSPEEYKKGCFCWHFFGKSDQFHEDGYFHYVRVVNQHIDYLSRYRKYLLSNKNIKPIQIQIINQKMIVFFERYIHILETGLDDKAKTYFAIKFREKLANIKADFLDIDTDLSIPDFSME